MYALKHFSIAQFDGDWASGRMSYKYILKFDTHTIFANMHTRTHVDFGLFRMDPTRKQKLINTIFELNKDQRKLCVVFAPRAKMLWPFLCRLFAQLTHDNYRAEIRLFHQRAELCFLSKINM